MVYNAAQLFYVIMCMTADGACNIHELFFCFIFRGAGRPSPITYQHHTPRSQWNSLPMLTTHSECSAGTYWCRMPPPIPLFLHPPNPRKLLDRPANGYCWLVNTCLGAGWVPLVFDINQWTTGFAGVFAWFAVMDFLAPNGCRNFCLSRVPQRFYVICNL